MNPNKSLITSQGTYGVYGVLSKVIMNMGTNMLIYIFSSYFNGPTLKNLLKALSFEKSNSWLYGTTGCNVQSLKIAESNLDEFISNLFFDLGMPDDQILLKDIENIRIKLLENRHNDEDEFAWYVQNF